MRTCVWRAAQEGDLRGAGDLDADALQLLQKLLQAVRPRRVRDAVRDAAIAHRHDAGRGLERAGCERGPPVRQHVVAEAAARLLTAVPQGGEQRHANAGVSPRRKDTAGTAGVSSGAARKAVTQASCSDTEPAAASRIGMHPALRGPRREHAAACRAVAASCTAPSAGKPVVLPPARHGRRARAPTASLTLCRRS
jgi:hypothetical protein